MSKYALLSIQGENWDLFKGKIGKNWKNGIKN